METETNYPTWVRIPIWRKGLSFHAPVPGKPIRVVCGRPALNMLLVRSERAAQYGMKPCPRCFTPPPLVA